MRRDQINIFMLQRQRIRAKSLISKKVQLEVGQPGWSNFIQPIDQMMPAHDFPCQCEMCVHYEQKKFNQAQQQQTRTIDNKIKARIMEGPALRQEVIEQNYLWVIKHLVIPHHKIATSGLNIHITETLFFKEGEAIEIYLSRQIQDPAIKRIAKEKLNNTLIQKIFSDRRRKYKDYIKSKTGRKKAEQKKRLFYGQKQVRKQIKDAVLVRYVDGYDQLISQNQFLSLFLRRKQDPIWKKIASVRNYLNIINPQQQNTYFVIKFKRDKIKYEQLYQRASNLVRVYGQYISIQQKQYITPRMEGQFIKQLKANNNMSVYAEYLVYQIVNYIEYFYDEQINNIVIGIFFDQVGNAFLNQVFKLQKKSLIKFQWTNQTYRKKMDESQSKVLQKKKQSELSKQDGIQKRASVIVKAMFGAYQKMRDKYGLTAEEQDDCEEVANNKFFRTIHPGFKHDISQILKDPNLTVSQFKKNYLGFSQKKKPIVRQFTSSMIKTLHLTSPKLKRSPPHDILQTPKRTHSTFNSTVRNIDNMLLSPLKLTERSRLSKLYQTLPVK